jgi:DNA mismatch repair protein MutL
MQYLFLNSRWIRDRSLGHALQEAYRGLIMAGRYAVAFLFLELPADQVDVNVHPTKAEVRFRDGHALWAFVNGTVRDRLSAENLTGRLRVSANPVGQRSGDTSSWFQPRAEEFSPSLFSRPPHMPSPERAAPIQAAAVAVPSPMTAAADDVQTDMARAAAAVAEGAKPQAAFKAIQLYNAYLVLETPEGMLVIDQHALHERILFEHLKARIAAGTLETQQLLIPEPVELSAEQAARTLEQRSALAELGLGVEDFGGGTVLVTSYPAILARRPPSAILKNVVDYLTSKERLPTREALLNGLLSLMACHAAVRAGDPLSQEEIAALVAQRAFADDTHHCPHGRPTALLFSRQDLDRQFRRV